MSAILEQLRAVSRQAQLDIENFLKKAYPEGTRVGVRLKHGQVNPTWGVVYRHWGDNLQVNFPDCRRPYRTINPDAIMEVGS